MFTMRKIVMLELGPSAWWKCTLTFKINTHCFRVLYFPLQIICDYLLLIYSNFSNNTNPMLNLIYKLSPKSTIILGFAWIVVILHIKITLVHIRATLFSCLNINVIQFALLKRKLKSITRLILWVQVDAILHYIIRLLCFIWYR